MDINQAVLWDENKLVAVCAWVLSGLRALYAGSLDDLPLAMRSAREDEDEMSKELKVEISGGTVPLLASGVLRRAPAAEFADHSGRGA